MSVLSIVGLVVSLMALVSALYSLISESVMQRRAADEEIKSQQEFMEKLDQHMRRVMRDLAEQQKRAQRRHT